MKKLKSILKLMRVHQWVKNGFLFLPLIFSGEFIHFNKDLVNILAFVSFSLMASTVYIFNDIRDVESDRKHSKKKTRPIAANIISVSFAWVLAAILLIISIFIALYLETSFVLILVTYLILNILYTTYLKHVAVVDIIVLAVFYIIRVLAGGIVTGVDLSSWILLTTFFFALFLGSGKRYAELANNGSSSRKVLEHYTNDFLKYVLTLASFSTILFYSLYTTTKSLAFELSIVFVVLGFMLYFYELFSGELVEDPVSALFKSKPLITLVVIWGFYMLGILAFKI
ncbi:MAG: decaprenyl-phosphate phosphoribosyltransferase [Candidatus Dojkabacteria bacterium]